MRYLAAIIFFVFTAFVKPAAAEDFMLKCFHNSKPESATVSLNVQQLKSLDIERVRIEQGKAKKHKKSLKIVTTGKGDAVWAQDDLWEGSIYEPFDVTQETIVLYADPNPPLTFKSMSTLQTVYTDGIIENHVNTYTCMDAKTEN